MRLLSSVAVFVWLCQFAFVISVPVPWLFNQGWLSMFCGIALGLADTASGVWLLKTIFSTTARKEA